MRTRYVHVCTKVASFPDPIPKKEKEGQVILEQLARPYDVEIQNI